MFGGSMRKLAFVLLFLAFLVGGGRLFTGVIYLSDEATAVLVLKREPALWIERPEARDRPYPQQIVLDSDELSLAYGWLYFPLMRAAPVVVPSMASVAALLLAMSRRREIRKRS